MPIMSTMFDQASGLRRLVDETHAKAPATDHSRPRLVVVAGGKGGVGTTTIAVNLAVGLAGQGKRAVLADASLTGSDAAAFCRVPERHTVADVLAGRRAVAGTLQPGPGGIRILAGVCGSSDLWDCAASAHDRLIAQLRDLKEEADFVVVDGGNGPSRFARRLWQAADLVLLVTTTEPASVFNAYAAVKTLAAGDSLLPLMTLVNMAPHAATAEKIHNRVALACRRFLGVPCRAAGHIDKVSQLNGMRRQSEPFVLTAPRCAAARQIKQLARLVIGQGGAQNAVVRMQFGVRS
jgi:flagellar biosynthesis protein FlhG